MESGATGKDDGLSLNSARHGNRLWTRNSSAAVDFCAIDAGLIRHRTSQNLNRESEVILGVARHLFRSPNGTGPHFINGPVLVRLPEHLAYLCCEIHRWSKAQSKSPLASRIQHSWCVVSQQTSLLLLARVHVFVCL